MRSPRAIIGAPVFNHEGEFREAIESILSQTFRDFRLVIVDDCSTDATEQIARKYAALDPRVEYYRNDRRVGMIANWRRAFDLGAERWPDAEYFAWASDHDVWHPRWLASLARELDENPSAVLAYPLHFRMAANSEIEDTRTWTFESRGVTQRLKRFNLAMWHMSAGNMVYGLARVADVRACGVFRHVLVPDRLLMMELSLRGQFCQVPEVLWFRRFYGRLFSLDRQRTSFFPNGRPLYAYVPWWISHAAVLSWVYGVKRKGELEITRAQGLLLGGTYFWLAGLLHFRQQLKGVRIAVRSRLRLTAKNILSGRRRRRLTDLAIRESRRTARRAVASVFRLGARGIRAVPGVGDALMDAVRPQRPVVETGALDLLHLQRIIARLRRTVRPIIVGPFLAEPEYELLYWIPFLRWLQKEAVIDPSQIVAVSRGGVETWYHGLCGRYVDALTLTGVPEVLARTEVGWHDSPERKLTPANVDATVITRVTRLAALRKPHVVNPAEMQRLFRHVWMGASDPDLIERHVIRQHLLPPPRPVGLALPDTYVAMRFAFTPSFPDTPENRRAARTLIESTAAGAGTTGRGGHPGGPGTEVVLLNTGVGPNGTPDANAEFDPGPLPHVHRIDASVTPVTALSVQSGIIARASRFVGSFDGLVCLAAHYGIPAVGVYSETPGMTPATLDAARRMASALRANVTLLRTHEVEGFAQSGTPVPRHEASVHGTV